MSKVTIDRALIEQAISGLPPDLRQKITAALAEPAVELVIERPNDKADYGHDNSVSVCCTPYYCTVCGAHMGDLPSPDDVPKRSEAVCCACRNTSPPPAEPAVEHCPNCAKLEGLCDATYVAQGADAYNHACDEMERWQEQRRRAGKEVGTTNSLCDGLSWLYQRLEELETPKSPPAEPTPVPLTWIKTSEQYPPAGVRVFWFNPQYNQVGYYTWMGSGYKFIAEYWMHIPEIGKAGL